MNNNNLPLGAEFDEDAPWRDEEIFLACPKCRSDDIESNGDLCQCMDCGHEGYFSYFAEEGKIQKDWGEDYE